MNVKTNVGHLKSVDCQDLFSGSKKVNERWTEHFEQLLNVPGEIETAALAKISQQEELTILD